MHLGHYLQKVLNSLGTLPAERKELLKEVANTITKRAKQDQETKLTFICTHNSRRSHLSQIWCQVAAAYYQIPQIATYSGGTEATACNIRTVRALRRAGLSIVASTKEQNPLYLVQYSEEQAPLRAYSKIYSEGDNPKEDFIAMICCSDADKRCPAVAGANTRFSLHYLDPKIADNTSAEATLYDERNFQIACEMFFVMSQVALNSPD